MPRIKLTRLPTPLEELRNFSAALGGPRIFMKRDDLTDLGLGGNKVRKLEYIMADVLSFGADVVITTGGVQTNHGRITAAAARKLGIKPVLVLTGEEPENYSGNLLIDFLYGAELHFVPADKSLPPAVRAQQQKKQAALKIAQVKADYEARGHKCYVVPLGGSMRIATAGYLGATLEMYGQLVEMGQKVGHLVVTTGSTSTTSALILANKVFNTGMRVVGISVWMPASECKNLILEELEKDAAFYEYDVHFKEDDFDIFDDYIGMAYGVPSTDGLKAVKMLAETEGILVDYSYTGKGLAGLVDLSRKGYFDNDEAVLFVHTGGAPALFTLDKPDFEKAIK